MKNNQISRRSFITKSGLVTAGATVGMSALANSRILGANEKIRVGFIGVGNRGSQLLGWFMDNDDVEIAGLSDVYEPYLARDRSAVHERYLALDKVPKLDEKFPNKVKRYNDFRELLEQKDIDAVCIATPDHWHAVQTIQAMDAGKDIYIEKPLTIVLKEGRAMVDAQKRTGKTVAVGLNRRGAPVYQKLSKEILGGKIGKVSTARALRISNMTPDGIGKMKPEDPPSDFDWDMWLGPRQFRPYQYNISPYSFRWWKEYSSQMGNWGVHYMDVLRWMMGETAPKYITAHGGKYAVNDDRDIPDTMEVLFEFESNKIIQFSIHEASSGGGIQGGEVELNGTKASLIANERGYKYVPARKGQFQKWISQIKEEEYILKEDTSLKERGISENSSVNLIRNFLDCLKTGDTPLCTLEDGHRSTSFAHLANIALETGQRLEWDAEKELFTNSKKANELLHYDYREPWKL
ncbi:MAG TPA: Gfo/Idh/MocA family oxidoreductase [Bacteroides sp.]|nr:Gfo/Idh/MocA family oxidoreductase [Bacteroides sp.]